MGTKSENSETRRKRAPGVSLTCSAHTTTVAMGEGPKVTNRVKDGDGAEAKTTVRENWTDRRRPRRGNNHAITGQVEDGHSKETPQGKKV